MLNSVDTLFLSFPNILVVTSPEPKSSEMAIATSFIAVFFRIVLINNAENLNLNSLNALLKIVEEPNENIYSGLKSLIQILTSGRNDWIKDYIIWELNLLTEIGYGLDLSKLLIPVGFKTKGNWSIELGKIYLEGGMGGKSIYPCP